MENRTNEREKIKEEENEKEQMNLNEWHNGKSRLNKRGEI